MKQQQFFHIFFRKEAHFICTSFLMKKAMAQGKVSNGRKYIKDFMSVKKFEKNLDISRDYNWFWKKFCCYADFKFLKIDQNLYKCKKMVKKFKKTKKYDYFFHLRPALGFQLNMFWNSKHVITTSFRKTYEISDFAPRKSTFFNDLLILTFPWPKIEVLLNKTRVCYQNSLKIWKLFA